MEGKTMKQLGDIDLVKFKDTWSKFVDAADNRTLAPGQIGVAIECFSLGLNYNIDKADLIRVKIVKILDDAIKLNNTANQENRERDAKHEAYSLILQLVKTL